MYVDPDSCLGRVIMVAGVPLFVAFLVFLVVNVARSIRSHHWPAVVGSVVESRVDRSVDAQGLPQSRANVRYAYTVAGRQLENDTIAFGLFRGMLTWGYADSRVARYPKGRVVSVFYDPQKPEVACLEQGGLGWEDVFMFIVSIAGVLFGMKELRKVIGRLAGSADARDTSVHSVPILP